MSQPQELRASGVRRESAKPLRGAERANVAGEGSVRDWASILAGASARGLSTGELASELGVTSQAVSNQCTRLGVSLTAKHQGPQFFHWHKPKFRCPDAWGLTRQQAQLVAILVDADGEVSNQTALDLITNPEERDSKILDVVLCHARKKLKRFNINIHRHWGRGLFLDPVQRKRLRAGAVTLKPSERTP